MDSKYIIGFLIGFIVALIPHLISDYSYQHTLQMIGEKRAVECILGKFYTCGNHRRRRRMADRLTTFLWGVCAGAFAMGVWCSLLVVSLTAKMKKEAKKDATL